MSSLIYILLRRLRAPLILLIIVYAISILGFVIIPGVDEHGEVWQMSFFHAFYFVSFMGTTIGFGEIPHAFTDAQRYWTIVALYSTVITWLYGIGALLSAVQDPGFRAQMKRNSFSRSINSTKDPFYIVCGYGDTGELLVRALDHVNIDSVVIDKDQQRINELEVANFVHPPLAICADASDSEVLKQAGITHPLCQGIVTLTSDDHINLTVSIVSQLLNPNARMIALAESNEAESNILSFGANEVINPFTVFAERLAIAISSPSLYCLHEWLTNSADQDISEPMTIDPGKWIVCGFGRFGRAIYEQLREHEVETVIIESDRSKRDVPSGSIIGRPTEAKSLQKAGIAEASAIIAGTDNDADNLSILMTAKELNAELFRCARQNQERNHEIFEAANVDMLMHRSRLVANRIFAFIRTPMLAEFLRIASRFRADKASALLTRIIAIIELEEMTLWEIEINHACAPAVTRLMEKRKQIVVEDLMRHLYDHDSSMAAIPLFMRRGSGNVMLPEDNRILREDDRLLVIGTEKAQLDLAYKLKSDTSMHFALTGEVVSESWLFRKINGSELV